MFRKKPYYIRMRGVNLLEYLENDKKLTLEGEKLAPSQGPSLVYWFQADQTWDKLPNVLISADDKNRIKNIIEQEFKRNGTIVEVEIAS